MAQAQRLLTAPCGCLVSAAVAGDPDAADTQELRLQVTIDAHQHCDQHKHLPERTEHHLTITKDS